MQSAPIQPLVPKTRGVKDPISTSSTLCCYFRFFSSSCFLEILDVAFPWLHLELTCVTLTSKNAVTPRDQQPSVFKSSLASRLVSALLRLNRSLSRGCSCGSTSTLVQTLPISEVSRLRTPPCLRHEPSLLALQGLADVILLTTKQTCLVSLTGAHYCFLSLRLSPT